MHEGFCGGKYIRVKECTRDMLGRNQSMEHVGEVYTSRLLWQSRRRSDYRRSWGVRFSRDQIRGRVGL